MRDSLKKQHAAGIYRWSTNLSRCQHATLNEISTNNKFIIVKSDKNLGPCIVERDRYIGLMLKNHLLDSKVYRKLPTKKQIKINAKKILKQFVHKARSEDIFMENEKTYFDTVLKRKKTQYLISMD